VLVCSGCSADSPDGSRFCRHCGQPLKASCPSCGAEAPPGFPFCASCGTRLAAPITGSHEPAPPVTERRVCSVLFADLVGFSTLSEARDAEETRELLSRYFDVCRTIIKRYGGVVEKFIGDAVMAVWGTPVAVEGDAERAVRAGIDLVAAVAALGEQLGVPELQLRAGVVTAEMAATIGAVGEGMVAGDSVNTAARVQAVAAAGAVWVDESTQRITAVAIGYRATGEHTLKGKALPVPLWEVTRVLSNVGGGQRTDGLEAPMLGRSTEERAVRDFFHATVELEQPRVVVVSGPAGIGKSRLGWEFEKYVDGLADPVNWHRGRCLSYGNGVAYWALTEAVRQRFGIAEDDTVEVATTAFLARLGDFVPDPAEQSFVGVRLGRLLGLAHPDDAGAELAADDLFTGWRIFWERLADESPVVLLIEDAQHADDGLLDFLEHLAQWVRQASLFVLVFARDDLLERRPSVGLGRNRLVLTLDALDDPTAARLVDSLVSDLPRDVVDQITRQAHGNPLFAIETIRSLIDRGVIEADESGYRLVGEIGALKVPDTLHGLLAARLDALDPVLRALVSDASVLGSTFPAEALAASSSRSLDEVRAGLDELVRRAVLEISDDPLSPQRGHYVFVQQGLRQVAYDTMSMRDRRVRHLAVAEHLQQVFADGGEEMMDVVAQHYLDALDLTGPQDADRVAVRDRAVASLTRAADRALRTGVPARSCALYARAAELVEDDDPLRAAGHWEESAEAGTWGDRIDAAVSAATRARELYLRQDLPLDGARAQWRIGQAMLRGGAAQESVPLFEEAVSILSEVPTVDTVSALCHFSRGLAFSGDPVGSRTHAYEALRLVQELDVPPALVGEAFATVGLANLFGQRMEEAIAAYRHAVVLARRCGDRRTEVVGLNNLSAASFPNHPASALEFADETAALARSLGSQIMLATALDNGFWARILVGDWSGAASHVLDIPESLDDLSTVGMAHLVRGDLDLARTHVAGFRERGTTDIQELHLWRAEHNTVIWFGGDDTQAPQQLFQTGESVDLASEAGLWGWPVSARLAFTTGDLAELERLCDVVDGQPVGLVPPLIRGTRLLVDAWRSTGDDAAERCRTALADLRAFDAPYFVAHALLDIADLCDGTEEGERARAEAADITERLGALDLRRRLGVRVS